MTQQGLRQKTVRALTGRALTYTGDWHALFDQEGIPTGTYEGRQLRWLNQVMGTSYQDIRQARQIFAEQNGAFNWDSMGEFDAFSLDAYMASLSDGAWWDFTRSDTMFQENIGPTPADGAGEVIGLALSQRLWGGQTRDQYVAGQTELVTNGGFDTDLTGWTTLYGNASWSSGRARLTRTAGTNARIRQALSCVVGRTYRLRFDVAAGDTNGIVSITTSDSSIAGAIYSNGFGVGSHEVYFTATQTTHWVFLWINGSTDSQYAEFDNISVREVTRYAATQANASYKPKKQAGGAAFDGLDDNLLTGYVAGGADSFLVIRATIPSTISATQVIAGAVEPTPSRNFYAAIDTSGLFRVGVGSTVGSVGLNDLRSQTVTLGLTTNGALRRCFVSDAMVDESAVANWAASVVPLRIGAFNNNGTASNFFGGTIQHVLAGREFIDLARFQQIANALQ